MAYVGGFRHFGLGCWGPGTGGASWCDGPRVGFEIVVVVIIFQKSER